jgi:acetyl-CoA C-acetyltransferase
VAKILAARRTPIGKFLGSLAGIPAVELGAIAVRATLADAGIGPADVDLVVFGHARQAGNGPNPARQVQKRAGIPLDRVAYTVNQACASGLLAIDLARKAVDCGEARIAVAGGMENMSRTPYLLDRARGGYRLGHAELVDGMYRDGFLCPLCGELMGETAENLAERYAISREEQDRYAVESQQRCERARKTGRFAREIAPVPLPDGGVLERDEHPRDGVTLESIAKLPPVFRANGTVHAGNSSGITDGAAAVVIAADDVPARGMARIVASASAGVDPRFMGLGPVPATAKLGRPVDSYDLIELNEAFAAQVLACHREMRFDFARTNVNGGAIALGHPIGATGARIVVTLLHEMERRGARSGLATLCVSGGLGMAMAFERGDK